MAISLAVVSAQDLSGVMTLAFYVGIFVAGASVLLGLAELVRPATLRLDESGFTVSDLGGLRVREFAWTNVKGIRAWRFKTLYGVYGPSIRMIRFSAMKNEARSNWRDTTFSSRFELEPEDLANLMRERQRGAVEVSGESYQDPDPGHWLDGELPI